MYPDKICILCTIASLATQPVVLQIMGTAILDRGLHTNPSCSPTTNANVLPTNRGAQRLDLYSRPVNVGGARPVIQCTSWIEVMDLHYAQAFLVRSVRVPATSKLFEPLALLFFFRCS